VQWRRTNLSSNHIVCKLKYIYLLNTTCSGVNTRKTVSQVILKVKSTHRCKSSSQWLTPVILATQEVEIRKISVEIPQGAKNRMTI
jgi:hypothetical protein